MRLHIYIQIYMYFHFDTSIYIYTFVNVSDMFAYADLQHPPPTKKKELEQIYNSLPIMNHIDNICQKLHPRSLT